MYLGTHLGPTDKATGAQIGPGTTLVSCEVGEGAEVIHTWAELAVIGDMGEHAQLLTAPTADAAVLATARLSYQCTPLASSANGRGAPVSGSAW